jgi:colanic acid/amylovoran biosynthesis glycosyltransferase
LISEKKIKRIAFSCPGFPIPSETFVLHQIVGFKILGYEVGIFPYVKCDSRLAADAYFVYRLEEDIRPSVHPPKNIYNRITKACRVFWCNRKMAAKLLRTLNPFILGKNALNLNVFYSAIPFLEVPPFDLYIGHFGESGEGLAKLKKCGFIKAPLVGIFHGYDLHIKADKNTKGHFYKCLFEKGNYFFTNSNYSLMQLQGLGAPKEKCFVIPESFFPEVFQPVEIRADVSNYKVVSVGRLVPFKGHAYAIEAIGELVKRGYKDVQYDIIGEGEQRGQLEHLIRKFGLENHVHLLGAQKNEEVQKRLSTAAIFLHPSITDSNGRAENQGLAIQEAQAIGLPVIAFDSGGIAEGIPAGTGIVVPEKDVTALTNALEKIISDTRMQRALGEHGKKWAQQYDTLLNNKKILNLVSAA